MLAIGAMASGATAVADGAGPGTWMALSSLLFWLLTSLLIGLLANRLPGQWLQPRGSRLTPEPNGKRPRRRAARPGIRAWKRWIPDAGPALPGGIAKASLVRRDPAALQRLLLETRRAALVHAVLWAAGLATVLWLPPAGVAVNLLFATAFNLPCLLLQGDNHRRLQGCLARLQGSQ
jgi:glycosyl-4,4'-diaponeurosporenoate acyltransferase